MVSSMLQVRLLLCFVGLLSACTAFQLSSPFIVSNALGANSRSLSSRPKLAALRMVDEAAVSDLVNKIESAAEAGKKAPRPAKKVLKALKKASGAVMVATEFSRGDAEQKENEHGVDFRTFSLHLRRNKAAVLAVDCSSPAGLADMEAFIAEQQTAKGNFPGPVPVVRSGTVTSIQQVAEAKAAGADGVLVSMEEEEAEALLSSCALLGIEALSVVSSPQQAEEAVEGGSKVVCVASSLSPSEAVDVRKSLPKDVASVAFLDARIGGGPKALQELAAKEEENLGKPDAEEPTLEILERGQELKDGGFNSIFISNACNDANDAEESGFHFFLLSALQSKKSSAFSKLANANAKTPLGIGRPPVTPSGFNTILEGSVRR